MIGPNRLLLDTNAVIALLAGNVTIRDAAEKAQWIGISVITRVEYLCSSRLKDEDETLFRQFLQDCAVVDLSNTDDQLIAEIVRIRRSKALRLPDAIVVATVISQGASLATADEQIIRQGLVDCFTF